MKTYKIIRLYYDAYPSHRIIDRGLTLEEAQAHCKDPETSSSTCKKPHNVRRTKRLGRWFDCYELEN